MSGFGLYTNRNSRGDFVRNAFNANGDPACNVYIAVAFFTDSGAIETLVAQGCTIRLVVRLGFPTSADALSRVLKLPGVEIRYFTDRSFHPKLYVFGTKVALVGSANLTNAATISNQEVVVEIGSTDLRLPELASLFNEYWGDAKVLTTEVLDNYRKICDKYAGLWSEENKQEKEIREKLGHVIAGNITRDKNKDAQENVFLEDFRKAYQECVSAFNAIRRVYEHFGKRKANAAFPLRLEIDSFISFIRETHAEGDVWMETPLISGIDREKRITELVAEWHETPWSYFEKTIVHENYPRLVNIFESSDSIKQANDDELFDALNVVHSFHERLRFFDGGQATWKKVFLGANDPTRTRENLSYLLYGPGKIEERIANLIYSPNYKLNELGQSSVQELVGWMNHEELPVINARTTKVLRYLGFDIRQL